MNTRLGEFVSVAQFNPSGWPWIGLKAAGLIGLFSAIAVDRNLGFAMVLAVTAFWGLGEKFKHDRLRRAIWCFQAQDQSPGVVRQIIENREVFELLERSAPDLLVRRWWVAGWFKSRDAYLIRLARLANAGFSDVEKELKPGTWKAWAERHPDVRESPILECDSSPQGTAS